MVPIRSNVAISKFKTAKKSSEMTLSERPFPALGAAPTALVQSLSPPVRELCPVLLSAAVRINALSSWCRRGVSK
jgi:hypothetical protein